MFMDSLEKHFFYYELEKKSFVIREVRISDLEVYSQ